MKLEDFVKKWTNKPVDVDGIWPNQCFDLFHQYHVDVLGITDLKTLSAASAYQIYTNFYNLKNHELFTRIANTLEGVPKKGDIVIFGQEIGEHGHVCIFIDGGVNRFNSFDSNWPIGSLPKIVSHTYKGVLGWLRFKGEIMTDQTSIDKATFEKLVANSEKWDKIVSYLELSGDPAKTPYEDVMNKIKGYKARETELSSKIKNLEAEVENRTEQVGRLKDQLLKQEELYSALSSELKNTTKNHEKAIGLLEGRIKDLQGQVDQMGKDKGKLNERIKELEAVVGFTILIRLPLLRMALVKF